MVRIIGSLAAELGCRDTGVDRGRSGAGSI
jgi:hypothetical protein